mmetsp:Transcript_18667/g.59471  ORF Transcript_18667/g.59471 Transcript_18667/m.59471 type:complete len:234 (-) Transcript_18667:419-1120(-)
MALAATSSASAFSRWADARSLALSNCAFASAALHFASCSISTLRASVYALVLRTSSRASLSPCLEATVCSACSRVRCTSSCIRAVTMATAEELIAAVRFESRISFDLSREADSSWACLSFSRFRWASSFSAASTILRISDRCLAICSLIMAWYAVVVCSVLARRSGSCADVILTLRKRTPKEVNLLLSPSFMSEANSSRRSSTRSAVTPYTRPRMASSTSAVIRLSSRDAPSE